MYRDAVYLGRNPYGPQQHSARCHLIEFPSGYFGIERLVKWIICRGINYICVDERGPCELSTDPRV